MTRARIAALLAVLALAALLLFLLSRRAGPPLETTTVASGAPTAATVADPARPPSRFGRVDARRKGLPPALPELTLAGRVVDAANRPVAGATVALAAPARTTPSDADGRFAFTALPPGPYVLEARREGGLAGPVRTHLRAGAKEVTLRLYRALTCEVLVVADTDGRPIAGADVTMRTVSPYEPAGLHRATTGADGIARFDGIQLAGHEVWASARGFGAVMIGPDFLDRDGDRWRTTLRLPAADGVEGRVVDEQGKPVAGAVIEAVPYQQQYGELRAEDEDRLRAEVGRADPHVVRLRRIGPRTDADGRFYLGLENDGRAFVVVASHPAYAAAASEPIFPTGKRTTHRVEIRVGKGGRVAGLVATREDEPVPGAIVTVRWQAGGIFERSAQADGTGRFEIDGLPEAPLELVASAEAGASARVPVDLSAARPEHDGVLLVLELTGAITGTVVDGAGRPLPDLFVSCLELNAATLPPRGYPMAESTGEDGRFACRGLAPGATYHVAATRPQDGDFVVHEGWVRARAGEDVTIRVPAAGRIVGRVAVPAGKRAAGLLVFDPQSQALARTGADGRFVLERLAPREYRLRISGAGVADAFVPPAVVEEGRDTDVGTIAIAAGREQHGVVVDPAGRPVDGAVVTATVDGRYRLRVGSDARGRFRLLVPAEAALVLVATHPSGDAPPLAVAAGATRDVTLRLAAGGTITGTATAEGKPAVNKVVVAWPAGSRLGEPTRFTQVDDAGRYRLENVPAGTYDVELMLSDDGVKVKVYREQVKVEPGQVLALDFDAPLGMNGGEEQLPPSGADLPLHEPSVGADGHGHGH